MAGVYKDLNKEEKRLDEIEKNEILKGKENHHSQSDLVCLEEAIYTSTNLSPIIIDEIDNQIISSENNIAGNEPQKLSYWKLCALTISILGVQFGWAVQIAFTSPLFLELGVPTYLVSFVWLAGPISGLIMQPLVGAISDQSTSKWGRRRPYIFFGSIFIVIAMILLSNAKEIGSLFGERRQKSLSIFIAVLGFWILDLANNTVQGPCRALIVDVVPPSQYSTASSLFTFMLGTGNLAGYFIGSLNLIKFMPFLGTNLRGTFAIGSIVLMICILCTVITIKEQRFEKQIINEMNGQKQRNFVFRIFGGIIKMPKPVQRLCIVTFFTWVGWFTVFLYITTWVATNILHGNPVAEEGTPERLQFQEGVRRGAFALILNSAVSMLTSLLLPTLLKWIGLRFVWFLSLLIMVVCLFLPIFTTTLAGAYVIIATLGVPWAVVLVAPFMVVASCVDESEAGLYLGIVNIFVVLPQLLVSAIIGSIIRHFNENVAYALAFGGISSIIASFSIFFVIYKEKSNVHVHTITGH